MRKNYAKSLQLVAGGLFLITAIASCKKDHPITPTPAKPVPLATIGLYEVDSGIYRRIFIPITQVGTQKVAFYGVFDTGSSGMTIDAHGILPASMITNTGITVAGDSVNVNGITVTSKRATISYGNKKDETQEYGNLAYAPVTVGNPDGSITTKRIPIFLYYQVKDITTGIVQPAHANDVFGVGPGVSFANNSIASPLSYFTTGTNVTSGFKLAMLNKTSFSISGTYVSGLLTIGLVPDDLSSSSGFILHTLNYFSQGGYSPDIPATITYNGKDVAATVLFDTGTPAISIIEDNGASAESDLPANSPVTISTSNGFTYRYTTSGTYDLTQIGKPSLTGDPRTIFSIDFFISNEFLIDYANHKIGLKNN